MPITMFNKYAVLDRHGALEREVGTLNVDEEDPEEKRLIGDSMIRGQLVEFCGRSPSKRKRYCMSGGRLDDFTAACDEATKDCSPNTLLILHASINDVLNTQSEELLKKYKDLIQRIKTKSRKFILSGILPRTEA